MAPRHRIVGRDLFARYLGHELTTILADPIEGVLVRLHVLGDSPSVEYAALWADLSAEQPRLACYEDRVDWTAAAFVEGNLALVDWPWQHRPRP
jgi:hypothetical protein